MSEDIAAESRKARGRPRLAPGLGRTESIRVHLTPAERAAFQTRADIRSTSISNVARDVLIASLDG